VTTLATSMADPTRQRDLWLFRVAGGLSVLAAALLAVSTVLPWTTRHGVQRTAFQLGSAISWVGVGAVLVTAAAVLLLAGLLTAFPVFRPNLTMPLVPTMVAGLVLANTWDLMFGATAPATTMGAGVILCLLGVATGIAATVCMLPAEHQRTR
jgi:hypothetical protein